MSDNPFKTPEILNYIRDHADTYQGFAHLLRTDPQDPETLTSRVAFAILSVQTPFDRACEGLKAFMELSPEERKSVRLVERALPTLLYKEVKVRGLTELAHNPKRAAYDPAETWKEWRARLARDFHGLGLAKASFAIGLLYPESADVACLDTHMMQILGVPELNGKLKRAKYEHYEDKVRAIARMFDLPTFLTQWLIWDHKRGKVEDHNIFPGSHK